MNKKMLKILIVCVCVLQVAMILQLSADDKIIPIARSTNMVHRRYYFVARLKRTMKLLSKIKEQTAKINFMLNERAFSRCFADVAFQHIQIQLCVEEILKTRSLKPLFMVWNDFSTYKSIEDKLFVEDFTKEVFIITRNILIGIAGQDNYIYDDSIRCVLNRAVDLPTDVLVEIIDEMATFLEKGNAHSAQLFLNRLPYLITKKRDQLGDLKPRVHSEEISIRFYYIHRLKESMALLKQLKRHRKNCFKLVHPTKKMHATFDDQVDFYDERVFLVIENMEASGDVAPLLGLCKEIKQFKFIDNQQILKEALIAIFIAQKNAFINHIQEYSEKDRSITVMQVIALYQTIESLPIEEILTAIDLVSGAMNEAMDQKDLSVTKPWKDLFAKYWWVQPMIIGGTVLFKVIKHYHLSDFLRTHFFGL